MVYRLNYYRIIFIIIIGIFPATSWPEIYSSKVTIIDGDLARAKDTAIREILNDVGLAGDVELRSATSMVNETLVQSSLLTSRVKLKEITVIEEVVVGDRFQIKIRIEKGLAPTSGCEPVVMIKNIDLILKNSSTTASSVEIRQGIQLFFDGLRESLETAYSGILSRSDYAQNPAYHLFGSIEPKDRDERNGNLLIFKIIGADGSTLQKFNYEIDVKSLIVKHREFTGYANLTRQIPSSDSKKLISRISKDIPIALRCIPVVVRIPEHKNNQIIQIEKVSSEKSTKPTLMFYSETFPIKTNGLIDLLTIKGNLNFSKMDDDFIYFELPKKNAGQPYPAPGNFLLIQ